MFENNNKNLYIIMIIFLVIGLSRYLTNTDQLLNLLLTLPAVLIAITFHEYAHAFVADKLGDDTPRRQGRLTVNPLAHLDPIGSLLLIFAGFGWGKPVEINSNRFTRKISRTAGDALVSIAGPIMNFIISIVLTIVFCAILKFAPTFGMSQIGAIILTIINVTILINIGLGIFNLIPLPPLDGSKVLRVFLPYNAKEWMDRYSRIFYFVFLLLWITGLAGYIISPIINGVYSGITWAIGSIFMLF